jgi:hypothetical protein
VMPPLPEVGSIRATVPIPRGGIVDAGSGPDTRIGKGAGR